MSSPELLFCILGANPKFLSKEEKQILEADLLVNTCQELKEVFKEKYLNYSNLIKYDIESELHMLDFNYIRWAIRDILLTGEYTISGIAYYTETPEDIVYEIVIGCNLRPSAIFLQKVIELHREVKPDLYLAIRKKIVEKYLTAA